MKGFEIWRKHIYTPGYTQEITKYLGRARLKINANLNTISKIN